MQKEMSIVWFRQDLRIADNLAMFEASAKGSILPIYILDDCAPKLFKMGSSTKVWLYHSLHKLNASLNGNLNLYVGESHHVIEALIKRYAVQHIFWNCCYEPWHLDQEEKVKNLCNRTSITWKSLNSNYLWHPKDIMKNDGSYYKVFTAYKKKSHFLPHRISLPISKDLRFCNDPINKTTLADLGLMPNYPWHKHIIPLWKIGEAAAQKKLSVFLKKCLSGYKEGRDYPANNQTSMLSPHLHFGEISPAQILRVIHNMGHLHAKDADTETFISELIWREFSCYLLYHFKSLHIENFNKKFNHFSWKNKPSFLKAWKTGNTGYPFIDAGMRQLWQTGYMHNRVRMIAASFLVKNLNIHWHQGRDWFWDCLLDADLANNSASWQWVAGCGADAAPYFRLFNPIRQGEKFDHHGDYTKQFVPELKAMPNKYLFKPWHAPDDVLKSAGVILGKTYPKPIVDFAQSRKKALQRNNRL